MLEKEAWERIIKLMNEALKLEYTLIVHYPRLADFLPNPRLREKLSLLSRDSALHAAMVARLIEQLGGQLQWTLYPFPEQLNPIRLFEGQLEKEKLALWLHTQAISLTQNHQLQETLRRIAQEEEADIRMLEAILAQLRSTPGQANVAPHPPKVC